MSVARFIADQRTNYRVPHTFTCALLGVSLAWFYKWVSRAKGPAAVSGLHTKRDLRRDSVDRAVRVMFGKRRGLHGSPRLHTDLVEDGWVVSEKTVADSMRRQGLIGGCQVVCVSEVGHMGLEVGVDAVGVDEGELAQGGFPALDDGAFDELAGGLSGAALG